MQQQHAGIDSGQHCAEIERCNQRGGRMLSIVDLIEAGTISRDLAAYSLAAIGAGASFMVGALPGGAGKTTVMGALLNFVPPDTPLAAADGDAAIEAGLADRSQRRCYICHEIGSGSYYAYLWGLSLHRYFDLPTAGHMLATNLHADTYEQAQWQVCGENGVTVAAFRRMKLMYFLSVTRTGTGLMRRIAAVWEGDGTEDHRQIYDGAGDAPAGSRLVAPDAFRAAGRTVDRLLQAGVRRIGEVRSFLCRAPAGLRIGPVTYGSAEYEATVALRDEILRKPLGLFLTDEQRKAESIDHHLACYLGDRLVGCLVLTPASDGAVKMRQVAVAADCQRQGIGTQLVAYAERIAADLGFRVMTAHAREVAVPFYERIGYTVEGPRFTEVGLPHFEIRKNLTQA